MIRKLVAVVLVALLPLSAVLGQAESGRAVLSIQPLSAVFGFYSAEYERAASKTVTWGLGGNYWSLGDDYDGDFKYTSGEFKLRYYPSGVALEGFSVGGSVGYTSVKGRSSTGSTSTEGAPSAGVLLEYQWLLGEKKNFAIALGAGAKALFISEDNFDSDFVAKYPTARISIGWVF
jgi:hypothetical protein